MARIRSLKPEYATSLSIADLSERAMLHFALLWTYADDEGRGIDDPRLIKAALWPLRDNITAKHVDDLQAELEQKGRVERYVVDGRRYFQITNFTEHQRPNRPAPSKFPPPNPDSPAEHLTEDSVNAHGALIPDSPAEHLTEDSVNAHGALIPVEEGRVDVEGEVVGGGHAPADADAVTPEVQQLCTHLADRIATHTGNPAPKVTSRWLQDMRLLHERGPTSWATPRTVPIDTIHRGIDFLYDQLNNRGTSDFCWADVIGSPAKLRKHWDKLTTEARRRRTPHQQASGAVDLARMMGVTFDDDQDADVRPLRAIGGAR